MANELPYFRFVIQAWQNGKISIENYELKGLFIDVCGYYWINDCSLTLTNLNKKFSNATILLKELIDLTIIKHEKRHDKVEIEFLNLQYDLLSEKRKSRQSAGSKGGNAKAKVKQKDGYNNKIIEDNDKIIKEPIVSFDFEELLNYINLSFGREFKLINDKTKKSFNARLKDGYSKIDIKNCIDNLKINDFHKEKEYQYCTPEFISRSGTMEKHSSKSNIIDQKTQIIQSLITLGQR